MTIRCIAFYFREEGCALPVVVCASTLIYALHLIDTAGIRLASREPYLTTIP
jgi:hypothetical protein